MKAFKLFESLIIGLLIGVVISTYILFMNTIGRDIGSILSSISLTNLTYTFPEQYNTSLIFIFLFYIVVYVIYTTLFNFVFRLHKKIGISLSLVLLILIIIAIFQQVDSFKKPLAIKDIQIKTVNSANLQSIKKYFGQEIFGDLNGDQMDDIAFLIKRNEGDDRGDMYYLSVALKIEGGYEGLNLVYIGEKILIEKLEIQDKIIIVSYKENNDLEEILQYKIMVDDKLLVEVVEDVQSKEPLEQETSEI